eukprot:11217300-Lingulodinium_polyedra.AAC.1
MIAAPRLLADDLEVVAFGKRHGRLTRRTHDAVGARLAAMGNKISNGLGESHAFASSKTGHRQLRRTCGARGQM